MIEAARILRALRLNTHRTVRVVLWGGHEGAAAGSRDYVRRHDAAKLFGYFNVRRDFGTVSTAATPLLRPVLVR